MSLRPPIAGKPTGVWTTTCTLEVPVYGQDSHGSPDVTSYTTTADLPCRIDPAGGTEAMEYGVGDVHRVRRQFVGYFPTHNADGSPLDIPAESRVTADGVRYEAKAAGSVYKDGMQSLPLEVQP